MPLNPSITNYAINTSGSTTTCTVQTSDGWATPTSGNILFAMVTFDGAGTTPSLTTRPTGFTSLGSYFAGAGWWLHYDLAWKVSDGTETSFTWTYTNGTEACCQIVEIEAADLDTSNYDAFNEDTTNNGNGTTYTTFGTGSITPSAANSLCIAFCGVESTNQWAYLTSYELTVNNGFTVQVNEGTGTNVARPSFFVATKVLQSSASTSCTFTTDGNGVRCYGAIVAFAQAGGGQSGVGSALVN